MTWGGVKCSQRCRGASQRGLTLIELVVCLAIMIALVGFTLNRSRDSMELAEKAAMETQYLALRSAMHLRVAKLISTGRTSELASFIGSNPMQWLGQEPANYLGAVAGETAVGGRVGAWYFDTISAELVYLASRHAHLKPDSAGRYRVRYQVSTAAAVKPGADLSMVWPVLSVVEPYQWF